MFNVSPIVLAVIALIALVLFILGLATDVGLFGWVAAIILFAYVIAAFVRGRRASSSG
jgi:membrane protein implicated in regulation of membrane protease activity